jgi:DNA-binding LacI/PurR family transcriptional regulator
MIEIVKNGPVTLRDVAEKVGVAQATASAVLNGTRSGTRVSEKTRLQLLEAAEQMGYRPNELARSLAKRRTRLIGFFSHFEYLSAQNEFLSDLVGGIHEASAEAEYDLVLRTVPQDSSADRIIANLADRRVDGIICLAPSDPNLLKRLAREYVPVVSVVDRSDDAPSITVDDELGGRLIARHLAEKGIRRAIYRDWHTSPNSGIDRRRGFTEEADLLGITVMTGKVMDVRHDGTLTDPERAWIDQERTAIVCWSDDAASVTCDALADAGYDIPGQVAVTGYNGIGTRRTRRWDLTTVVAPWRVVGQQSVATLLDFLDSPIAPANRILPVGFHVGATT